ncbi:MAG: 4-alpha-glucanotransferase [Gammaproteobacteria bacterium]
MSSAASRLPVLDRRRAGVLLHLSSLGPGALGRPARAFIDWLAKAGFSVWQILPLGPTGPGGSPYWVRSDHAGNPAFIDASDAAVHDDAAYGRFIDRSREWLDDYARFESLSALHAGVPWWQWPAEHRDREADAMERIDREHAQPLERVRREQFVFERQWQTLRAYAHERGVRLFGDVPFYIAPDSADTWSHPDQFQLERDGRPRAVAGVPPDYFSETGQLWGNPLYDWNAMRRDGFSLWRERVRRQLERVDLLRIDHFRALAAHWAVPASAPDARGGAWRRTPGRSLLRALQAELGDLPVVAEDLGFITPDVKALLKRFSLPGMRVLQFAFGGTADNVHLPHMHTRDMVIYTGTHDNDTTLGWYRALDSDTRRRVDFYLRSSADEMPEALVCAALGSVGQLAIVPIQDLLGLGSEARLNTPATTVGNWTWRLPAGALSEELSRRTAVLTGAYGRS